MNGEYLRGEVYWISSGDSLGSELQSGRPGVIISNDFANREQETVVVAFLTQSEKPRGVQQFHIKTRVCGEEKRVVCQQIRTVDKSRLLRFVARISNADMARVSGALATSLSLPPPATYEPEAETEKENDETLKLRLELEVMKKMYDRVLNQLVEMKVAADIAEREEEYEYEEEDVEEEIEEIEPEPEEEVTEENVAPAPRKARKVNVNTATWEELVEIAGLAERPAKEIVRYRKKNGQFKRIKDLLNVSRFGLGCFNKYRSKLVVGEAELDLPTVKEVKQTVVNINTANAPEIMSALGCPRSYAGYIVTHRNKHGYYKDLNELLNVRFLPKTFLTKYADYLIIGEVKEEEAPVQPVMIDGKININVATKEEIMSALGCPHQYAGYIAYYRVKNGNYVSLEELYDIPYLSKKFIDANISRFTLSEEEPSAEEEKLPEVEESPEIEEPSAEEEKLNINTATAWDFLALGFDRDVAARIVSYRKNYRKFNSVEDLWLVHGVTGKIMRKVADKLCV